MAYKDEIIDGSYDRKISFVDEIITSNTRIYNYMN